MVRKYTDDELLSKVKTLSNFKGIPNERWILGVRSKHDLTNKFDDKFYFYEGEKFIDVMTGTTNAGLTYLKGGFKTYNKLGCAILKSDEWFYNVWQFGLHRGKMKALRQVGAKVKIYRDNDLDGKAEEIGDIYSGWFGINFHTNTYDFSKENLKIKKTDINNWSAGCQVANDREKYAEQMSYFEFALKNGTQKFVSYCLINEF